MAKILFEPKVYQQHLISFYYSKTGDVPRYDRLSEMKRKNTKICGMDLWTREISVK